jgi:hypothetical protein
VLASSSSAAADALESGDEEEKKTTSAAAAASHRQEEVDPFVSAIRCRERYGPTGFNDVTRILADPSMVALKISKQERTTDDDKFDAKLYQSKVASLTQAEVKYTTLFDGSCEHAHNARQKYQTRVTAGLPANAVDAELQERRRDELQLALDGIRERLHKLLNVATAPQLRAEFNKVAIDVTCADAMCWCEVC